ncbi:MAG TPA: hypothetical protein PKE69_26000 [Pyrinomonadaceae bacterium]|nr:hypothetical protein [Pyrinomonadaceae bacterium]
MLREIVISAVGLDYELAEKRDTWDKGKIQKSTTRKMVLNSKAILSPTLGKYLLYIKEYDTAFEKEGIINKGKNVFNVPYRTFDEFIQVLKAGLIDLGINLDEFASNYEVRQVSLSKENKNQSLPCFNFSSKNEVGAIEMAVNTREALYKHSYKKPILLKDFIDKSLYEKDVLHSAEFLWDNAINAIWSFRIDDKEFCEKSVFDNFIA